METITNNAATTAAAKARRLCFGDQVKMAGDLCDFKFMVSFDLEHLDSEVQR
jgi:hypothetical protein